MDQRSERLEEVGTHWVPLVKIAPDGHFRLHTEA